MTLFSVVKSMGAYSDWTRQFNRIRVGHLWTNCTNLNRQANTRHRSWPALPEPVKNGPAPASAPAPAPIKSRFWTMNFFFYNKPTSSLDKIENLFISKYRYLFLISISSMLEQTKRISFRISFVLSKVELEPGAGAGPSHWLRLRPTKTYRLRPAPAP